MLDPGKINSNQLTMLLITLVAATATLYVPAVTAKAAGPDGWVSLLFIATGYGLAVALICSSLGRRFPKETVVEYAPGVFGTVLGRLVGAYYIFVFLWLTSTVLWEFGNFMVTAFMPETPRIVFNGFLMLVAAYAVRNGIEVIGRAIQFLFPLLVLAFLLLIVLSVDQMQASNLQPVLAEGLLPPLKASLAPSGWRGQIVVLLMLLPHLNNPDEGRKSSIVAVILLGILLAIDFVATVAVFGPELTSHLSFPYFFLARHGRLSVILERMEALVMVIWVAGIMIKVSLFFYCAVLGLAQLAGLKDYKPLVFPTAIVTVALGRLVFHNTPDLLSFIGTSWFPFAITFELLIPAALLAVALIRRLGVKTQ